MKGATGTAESIWTRKAIHTVLNPTRKDRPWVPQAPEILGDLKYQVYWMERCPLFMGQKIRNNEQPEYLGGHEITKETANKVST